MAKPRNIRVFHSTLRNISQRTISVKPDREAPSGSAAFGPGWRAGDTLSRVARPMRTGPAMGVKVNPRAQSRGARLARGRRLAALLAGAWRESAPSLPGWSGEHLRMLAPGLLQGGVGGLAWSRLRDSPLAGTPAAEELRQAYRLNVLQAALQEARIARAVSALRAAGIEPLLAKGWAVAREYADPGYRPCGDIDLYVPASAVRSARRALAGAAGDGVDLHAGLAEISDRDLPAALERGQRLRAAEVEVRVPAPEDQLRLVALHALRHGVIRPLWLCDVACLVERADGFDWGYFESGDPRRAGWASAALCLARDLLGASLDKVPERLARRRLPGWMAATVLREWGAGRAPHGARRPMAALERRPRVLLEALRLRWPNGIEASIALRAPFGSFPRLPLQVGDGLVRSLRFVLHRPGRTDE